MNKEHKSDNTKDIPSGTEDGFTLLELLISITVLGLMILVMSGSISIGLKSVDKGEREVSRQERLRGTFTLVDRQISSMVKALRPVEGERVVWFEGDQKSCLFLTERSLWGWKEGISEVRYEISESPADGLIIAESERIPWLEEGAEPDTYTMLDGLEEAEFRYLDTNTSGEKEWIEEWTSKDHYPEAIALFLKGPGFEYSLVFPVLTEGRTERKTRSRTETTSSERRLFPFKGQ